jgi:acyl-CoA thioester hydrolase
MSPHTLDYRIAYADTDRMGVMYYANHFVLFERGRTELLRSAGVRYRDLEENPGVFLPAMRVECDYKAPAHYDDLVRLTTTVIEVGRASVTFAYRLEEVESGRLLTVAMSRHPLVNRAWKPVPFPESLRRVMEGLRG